jgi:pSer/pThr/pTyr-binding forkhead associated (FHA) protein
MQAYVLFLLRVGILVVLWLFVLAAIFVIRSDLSGARSAGTSGAIRPVPPPPKQRRRDRSSSRRAGVNRLVVTEGGMAGTTVPLRDEPVTIGRAHDSTLVLTDEYASSRHARLTPNGALWVLEDLGSTNGTYLNRQRVTRPTPVGPGVPIRIGKTVMELRR